MGLNTYTVVDWKNFYRDITVDYFVHNPTKIGLYGNPCYHFLIYFVLYIGAGGAIVEIDETVITSPKYNEARLSRLSNGGGGG